MKRSLLLCLCVCMSTIFSVTAQTYNLGNFYRNYQRITVRDVNRVFDQEGGQYDSNVYVANRHGGANQQWAVMPLYIRADQGDVQISRDHIIACRSNGKVLDISGSTNIYCYPSFHGGDNQVFNFNSRPSNFFEITSPSNTGRVFDRTGSSKNRNPFKHPTKHRDNIYSGNLHGGNNQQFSFINEGALPDRITSIRYRRIVDIPFPPNPKGLYTPENNETSEVFYSETLIPFPLVKNDLPPSAQVTRTPYYRLVRTQFWKKPGVSGPADEQPDQIFRPGEVRERTIRVKTGVKISESEETFRKLNVGFTSSQEVGGPIGPLTAKVTRSLSLGLELSQKNTVTKEETYEREETLKTTFTSTEIMRAIHYIKIDRYRLLRIDGVEISRWDVNTNVKHIATFPEAEVEGRPNGRTFKIKPKSSGGNSYDICWKDVVGLQVNGNSLKKTNTTSWWNAGAASVGKLPARKDGWIEMTASETNTHRMFGLSKTNTNATWDSIEYNFYLMAGGKIKIYEKGIFKTDGGTYKVGDKIRVERAWNKILYKKNGSTIYSSPTNPHIPLMADISMYNPNGTITNAKASFSCSSRSAGIVGPIAQVKNNLDDSKVENIKASTKVYPNPSNGIYTLDFGEKVNNFLIRVYTINGNLIYEKNIKNTKMNRFNIDLTSQSKGIYLMSLSHKGGSITKKLIRN